MTEYSDQINRLRNYIDSMWKDRDLTSQARYETTRATLVALIARDENPESYFVKYADELTARDAATGLAQRTAEMITVRRLSETLMQLAVDTDRADGATWAQVGAALDITRQAAQQRYSR